MVSPLLQLLKSRNSLAKMRKGAGKCRTAWNASSRGHNHKIKILATRKWYVIRRFLYIFIPFRYKNDGCCTFIDK